MNDPSAAQPDPLEEMLRPPKTPGADDPLRQALGQQTMRLLRRRRRFKRLALAAALAACYFAGMMTMRFGMPPGESDNSRVDQSAHRPKEKAPRPPAPKQTKQPDSPPATEELALDLEWRAIDSTKERFALYRRAGDLYLQENDVPSALRCYRGALAAASPQERTLSVSDNWLFMIAKEERQKEKSDANNGG